MHAQLPKIYSAFSPAPLQSGQQDLYINLDDVRGNTGIVQRMAQKIRLADEPTCQVLTGHRGSGKSTELWRVRHALQEPSGEAPRLFVVQVQADDELDRNDVDFPEVLIAIVRQVAASSANVPTSNSNRATSATVGIVSSSLRLKEVSFEGLELEAGMATIAATIRNSPDARLELRKVLEPDTNNWLTAANDVLGVAVQELQKRGYHGLVVIVDDLDKMIMRPHESAGCSTTEYLFVHRSRN